MKFLGIDIGSTSVKAALFDLCDNSVISIRKFDSPRRSLYSNPRFFQVPAEAYLRLIQRLLDSTAAEFPDLEGVVLSTQMHGFVLDDIYISWQDSRCLEPLEYGGCALDQLKQLLPPQRMERSGVYLKPSLGLCNLYAKLLQEHTPGRSGELYTLGSYLIARLTGQNICHISNAAPLGLVDLTSGDWDRALLEMAGGGNLHLPAIAREEFAPCGIYRVLNRDIKIFPDYGDQQISILGSGAQSTEAVINIATAAQVAVFSSHWEPGAYESRPYFENSFIHVISNMPAGRNLDVLVEFFRQTLTQMTGKNWFSDEVRKEIDEHFEMDPGGLRADISFYPTQNTFNGGRIEGITAENLTVNGLFSAAYQAMADAYWQHLCMLRAPEDIHSIVCAGGVSWKNPHLIQTIERTTGKSCRLSAYPDEAVFGLFKVAYRCAGKANKLSDAPFPQLKIST